MGEAVVEKGDNSKVGFSKKEIKISVIVPVYKAEKYLEQCVESLLNQTYHDVEIILVDDGSPDNCPKICEDFQKKDDRVRVIHKKNEGVAFARRDGVLSATGEYVTFCDADDMLDLSALEKGVKAVHDYHPDIISFGMTKNRTFLGKKGIQKYYNREKLEKEIFPYLLEDKRGKYYAPSVWGAFYKRKLYIDNQLSDYKVVVGEDLASRKAVTFHAQSMLEMEDKLYYYRVNEESCTQSRRSFPWEGPELIARHLSQKIDLNAFDMYNQLTRVITHQLFFVAKSQFARTDATYWQIRNDIKKHIQKPIYKNAIEECHYDLCYIKGNIAKVALKYHCCFLIWFFYKMGM